MILAPSSSLLSSSSCATSSALSLYAPTDDAAFLNGENADTTETALATKVADLALSSAAARRFCSFADSTRLSRSDDVSGADSSGDASSAGRLAVTYGSLFFLSSVARAGCSRSSAAVSHASRASPRPTARPFSSSSSFRLFGNHATAPPRASTCGAYPLRRRVYPSSEGGARKGGPPPAPYVSGSGAGPMPRTCLTPSSTANDQVDSRRCFLRQRMATCAAMARLRHSRICSTENRDPRDVLSFTMSSSSSSSSSTGGGSRPSRSLSKARLSIIWRTASRIVSLAVDDDALRASPALTACACFSSCVNTFPDGGAAAPARGGDVGLPRSSLGLHIVVALAAPGARKEPAGVEGPGASIQGLATRRSTLAAGVRGARSSRLPARAISTVIAGPRPRAPALAVGGAQNTPQHPQQRLV